MRVALLSRAVFGLHGYGGMERHVLELARFLCRAGVQVTVVTPPPTRDEKWAEPGVELQIVKTPRLPLRGIADRVTNYPYWSRAAGRFVAREAFDLVHAQGLSGWGYACELASGRARAPLILAPQGMEEFKTTRAKRLAYTPFHILEREAARRAAAVIAADSTAVADIPRFLRIPSSKVALIPNGIDVEAALGWVSADVQQELMDRLGLHSRAPILLSVGRLEENKGFHIMLDALARIQSSLSAGWLWLVVGSGSQQRRLEAKAEELGLADHIRLLGSLDDRALHNLYELATLFVHPTLFEGSVLVTLEAMAHRLPVVATAVGGNPDKVFPGQNGFLAPPGDAHLLGERILLALSDHRRLCAMGEESYKIVRERFDWPRTIGQTIALYCNLASSWSALITEKRNA